MYMLGYLFQKSTFEGLIRKKGRIKDIGVGGVGGGWVVHSTSWKCGLYFVYIFRTDWKFLIKFCSLDPSFNGNILSLYIENLKHLRMCTLQLLIYIFLIAYLQIAYLQYAHYLQTSSYDMNFKLSLVYILINEVDQ